MRTDGLMIVGAGGHAKVVIDAACAAGWAASQLWLVDDDPARHGCELLGITVVGPVAAGIVAKAAFHMGIGRNDLRERISSICLAAGMRPATVRHPDASVSHHAMVSHGCFIAAKAVIAPSAILGAHVIVNHGAVIDHDCVIGDACHIAPGASLAGAVRLGRRVLIGAGAAVLPGLSIGDDAVVGAGAVVLTDVPSGTVVVGVPARTAPGLNA